MKIFSSVLLIMLSLAAYCLPDGILHQDIKGKDRVYTKADIDSIVENLVSEINFYPMFIIELNTDIGELTVTKDGGYVTDIAFSTSTVDSMSDWTSFELKASTNNFQSATTASRLIVSNVIDSTLITNSIVVPGLAEKGKLLYWRPSEYPNDPDEKMESKMSMRKYACDVFDSHDVRGWNYFDSNSQLQNRYQNRVIVVLDPTQFKKDPVWCCSTNSNIIWSYVRISDDTLEVDGNGNPCWRPISPVKWFKHLPDWCYTNNEIRVLRSDLPEFKSE